MSLHGNNLITNSARCTVLLFTGETVNLKVYMLLSRVKQITRPGWMHETSARIWCSGKTWRERVEREVGRGIGMGKTCKLKADSFQCMTKFTTNLKKKKRKKNNKKKKKIYMSKLCSHKTSGSR